MGRDLTNLYIDETFQYLLQKSGSEVQNGLGVRQDFLDVSASYAISSSQADIATNAFSASIANTANTALLATTASYAVTASYALNVPSFDSSSLLVTASFDNGTRDLTFTKGDASTFAVNIPDASGSTLPPGGVNDMFLTTDGAGNVSWDWVKTLHQNIHNHEATAILRGTPLFVSGATGDNANVYIADAANPARRPATLIAYDATLAPNETGTAIISGEIQGVDTNLYPAGTVVYLAAGGGWTATRPTGSATSVQSLGVITRSANNGRGIVFNQIGNNLPNLQQGRVWVGGNGDLPTPVETGSLSVFYAVSASYATSASYEIVKEVSSSYADYAKEAGYATSSLSSSYAVTASHALNAGTWDGQFSGSAAITGSLTVIGDSTVQLTQQDLSSTFEVKKGLSSYTLGINQFPGFTGSILSANNVQEFKVTGDTSLALDNTGYGGSNQVALRSSGDISLVSANGVSSDNNVTITGQTQNALRIGTTGSADYVTIAGPTSIPYTFDGNYIQNVNKLRDSSNFNFINHLAGGNTDIAASGSATSKISNYVNGNEVFKVFNQPGGTRGVEVTGNVLSMNMIDTGSYGLFVNYYGGPTSAAQMLMGVSGFDAGGQWQTTTNFNFSGADSSFIGAEGNLFIKNIYNDSGSVYIWSENQLTLRGDTAVSIQGDADIIPVDIYGKTFATSIASNINGFSTIINQDSNVRQNVRAFVETPMQVNTGVTITIESGATLKVINEL